MDEKKFLEEHPSLCMNVSAGSTNNVPTFSALDIHETQLDKQNIINTLNHWLQTEKGLLMAIKKELGFNTEKPPKTR